MDTKHAHHTCPSSEFPIFLSKQKHPVFQQTTRALEKLDSYCISTTSRCCSVGTDWLFHGCNCGRERCDLVGCEMFSQRGLLFIWEIWSAAFSGGRPKCFPAVAVEHFAARSKTLADQCNGDNIDTS